MPSRHYCCCCDPADAVTAGHWLWAHRKTRSGTRRTPPLTLLQRSPDPAARRIPKHNSGRNYSSAGIGGWRPSRRRASRRSRLPSFFSFCDERLAYYVRFNVVMYVSDLVSDGRTDTMAHLVSDFTIAGTEDLHVHQTRFRSLARISRCSLSLETFSSYLGSAHCMYH